MSWVSELRRRNLKVMALHSLGDEEAAEETLNHLMGEADASAMDLAIVYAFRGQTDRAIDLLEAKFREDGNGEFYNIAGEPLLQNLQREPRWTKFLTEIERSPEQLAAIDFSIKLPR